MKATVLEITDGRISLLTDEGDFVSVAMERCGDVTCGDRINYEAEEKVLFGDRFLGKLQLRYGVLALAVLVLFILPFSLLNQSPVVAGYVTMDINPSIQLAYAEDYHVLSVEGLDQEGEDLITRVPSLKGTVLEVVRRLMLEVEKQGYADGNKNGLLLTVVSEDDEVELTESLEAYMAEEVDLKTAVLHGALADKAEAEAEGMSAGLLLSKEVAVSQGFIYDLEEEVSTLELVEILLGEYEEETDDRDDLEEESEEDEEPEDAEESEEDEAQEAEEVEEPEESEEFEEAEEAEEPEDLEEAEKDEEPEDTEASEEDEEPGDTEESEEDEEPEDTEASKEDEEPKESEESEEDEEPEDSEAPEEEGSDDSEASEEAGESED